MTGKSFKGKVNIDEPAERFITSKEEQPPQGGNVPAGYKLVPIEKKTQRIQLVMRPSLVSKCKEYAKERGLSFNELCNIALEEYLNK